MSKRNLNKLEDFSECLNITWNNKLYENKYCLGEILLEKQEKRLQMSHHLSNGVLSNIWESHDDDQHNKLRSVTALP